jgi:hypothetical protein
MLACRESTQNQVQTSGCHSTNERNFGHVLLKQLCLHHSAPHNLKLEEAAAQTMEKKKLPNPMVLKCSLSGNPRKIKSRQLAATQPMTGVQQRSCWWLLSTELSQCEEGITWFDHEM